MTGPTMTPSDMFSSPEHAHQHDLDAAGAEAVLSGAQPSGDPALDAALDALRGLVTAMPEPSGELADLLGPVVVPAPMDELGRRRQGSARHVATGTTVVAGILLATATAAAAIGTLGGTEDAARPTPPPAVVSPSETEVPHPVGATPTELPVLPVASSDASHAESGESSTTRHEKGRLGSVPAAPRLAHSSDDPGEADEPGEGDDADQTGEDEPSTGYSTAPAVEDDDSSGTSTSDGGGDDSEGGGTAHDRDAITP